MKILRIPITAKRNYRKKSHYRLAPATNRLRRRRHRHSHSHQQRHRGENPKRYAFELNFGQFYRTRATFDLV